MPNQLSSTKKRKTVADHVAVLALLESIAEAEGLSSTDLLRRAARSVVREHMEDSVHAMRLREIFESYCPQPESSFRSPAALKRFKRQQREYDQLALELNLLDAATVQARNSVQRSDRRPVLVGSM